jgi:predicted Zn finger-like uncharacterized protein
MILTCTSCATRYFADDASVGPEGRTVRCAACGHSWFVAPQLVLDRPADAAPATFVEAPPQDDGGLTREQIERARQATQKPLSAAAMARAKQVERQRKEKIKQAAIAWSGAAGALALTLTLGVVLRQDVARIWPNTASVYATIGMPVNITGLEFSQIDVAKTFDGPTPMIVVTGSVKNVSRGVKAAPSIRFALRDETGEELTHWIADLPGEALQPGAARTFRSTLDAPISSAVDLEARFATKSELLAEAEQLRPRPKAKPEANDHQIVESEGHHDPEGGPEELITPLMPPDAFSGANDGLAPRLPAEPARGRGFQD